jgi:hypothetical protein
MLKIPTGNVLNIKKFLGEFKIAVENPQKYLDYKSKILMKQFQNSLEINPQLNKILKG